jgi:hypothetical protein
MSVTPIFALALSLAILARAEHHHRTNPAVEMPARTVGVLAISMSALALGMIVW